VISPDEAREALCRVAESAGRKGRPLDAVDALMGMGLRAGVGDYWGLYAALAREWAVGRMGWLEADCWTAIADAEAFEYEAEEAAGL